MATGCKEGLANLTFHYNPSKETIALPAAKPFRNPDEAKLVGGLEGMEHILVVAAFSTL